MDNGIQKPTTDKKAALAFGVGALVLLTGILSIGILAQQAAAQTPAKPMPPGGAQKPGTPPTNPPAKPPTQPKALDIPALS